LLRHWLRIRDSVMSEKQGQRGQVLQGQEPMPYSSFAGNLGSNSHPAEIQRLLDEVRKRPQDYKALLLTIIFDPFPGYSSRLALKEARFESKGRRKRLEMPLDPWFDGGD
jgi:hypothetical protein